MESTPQPDPKVTSEIASSVSLIDFLDLFMHYLKPFLAGLILVALLALAWCKMVATVYYGAEATFSVGRLGLVEMQQIYEANRPVDRSLLQQIAQSQEWLVSRELLLEAVERLAHPRDAKQPACDLYRLLSIHEASRQLSEAMLVEKLQKDLTDVKQIEESGVIKFRVELPDADAAARLANLCIAILEERFIDDIYRYPNQVTQVYEEELKKQNVERGELAKELMQLSLYDVSPAVQSQRGIIQSRLDRQAGAIATLMENIRHLKMATDMRAKSAAQPITIIQSAYPPLKKSRPLTTLTILMAAAIYTFIFMLGMAGIGFAHAVRRQRPSAPLGD